MKQLSIIALLFITSSCGFNFMFLHPWKLKEDESITFKGKQEDTVVLQFKGHTPSLLIDNLASSDTTFSFRSEFLVNENNDSINAWWMDPTSPYIGRTIFFLHGNAANLAYQFQGMIPFVRDGYRIVAIDYSGFGFSQGKAKRKFLIDDARMAFESFISNKMKQDEKVIIYGQSLGGHLSTVIASEYETDVDLLVTEGAFASHKDIASDMAGFLGRMFVKEGYSGKEAIKDFQKPYLIIHSTEDKVVPYWHSNELMSATSDRAQLLTIDKCHICGPSYYYDTIQRSMDNLLK